MEEDIVLSDRKKTILFFAIDNYIKLASPITSLLVQQTELTDISTATIRNELNALEAMGFLKQLHTSSGRVPTSKGYRFFVNEVLAKTPKVSKNLTEIKDIMFSRTNNLTQIVEGITKAISNTTNYPTVVMLDGLDNLVIQSIKIVYLLSNQVLVLIETNAGAISNTIQCSNLVSKQDCENASKIFTDCFYNKSLSFLTKNIEEFNESIKSSMKNYEEVFKLVLTVINSYQNAQSNVSNKGLIKLLENKEFSNSAKNILSVLDDEKTLSNVITSNEDEGVTVKIGKENSCSSLSECAVVKAPLILDGKKIATVGVIGPERIDYATVASVLKYVSDQIKKGGTNIG